MRRSLFTVGIFIAGLTAMAVSACSSSDDSKTDASTTGDAAAGEASVPTVTYAMVKPIFMAKCSPCHTATGTAAVFHTLADSYTSANKPSAACPGKKIGECTLVRIKSGQMPKNAGCSGDPVADMGQTKCLSQADQDKLQAWINAGLPE